MSEFTFTEVEDRFGCVSITATLKVEHTAKIDRHYKGIARIKDRMRELLEHKILNQVYLNRRAEFNEEVYKLQMAHPHSQEFLDQINKIMTMARHL